MRKMRNEKDDKNDMDDTNSNDEKDDKDDKNDLVTSGWSFQHVAWLPNKAAGIGGWGLGVWIFGGHKVGSMAKQTYPGIQVPFITRIKLSETRIPQNAVIYHHFAF